MHWPEENGSILRFQWTNPWCLCRSTRQSAAANQAPTHSTSSSLLPTLRPPEAWPPCQTSSPSTGCQAFQPQLQTQHLRWRLQHPGHPPTGAFCVQGRVTHQPEWTRLLALWDDGACDDAHAINCYRTSGSGGYGTTRWSLATPCRLTTSGKACLPRLMLCTKTVKGSLCFSKVRKESESDFTFVFTFSTYCCMNAHTRKHRHISAAGVMLFCWLQVGGWERAKKWSNEPKLAASKHRNKNNLGKNFCKDRNSRCF